MGKIAQPPQLQADFFASNRQKLRKLFAGTAPTVITGSSYIQKSGDTVFPFRQDNNFWYLTGIDEPGLTLVIDTANEYVILPPKNPRREVFDGAIDEQHLQRTSGIEEFLSHEDGWKKLSKKLKRVKHVATLQPPAAFIEPLQMFTNPARRWLIDALMDCNESLQILDLQSTFVRMRSVKSSEEIEIIEYAVAKTEELFSKLQKKIGTYKNEREIAAEVLYFAESNGLDLGYDSVIAGGVNATTLHYVQNNLALSPEMPVLLDIGLSYSHYSADITRTICKSPSKRYRQVDEAVRSVYDFALKNLKPGVLLTDYEKEVEHFMGEKLRALGLIGTINTEEVRRFYPHSTSHFLGLDVHDVGDYTEPLVPGMVMTVEPGIYIKEEGFGIRFENDIVITETGNRVLSKGAI